MAAHQVPPSLGFSRQEHWSELPFPSPGDLPDPEIEPRSRQQILPEHLQCGSPAPDPGCVDGRDLALIGFVYLQEIKAVSEQAGNTQGSQCVVGATEQAERGGEACGRPHRGDCQGLTAVTRGHLGSPLEGCCACVCR